MPTTFSPLRFQNLTTSLRCEYLPNFQFLKNCRVYPHSIFDPGSIIKLHFIFKFRIVHSKNYILYVHSTIYIYVGQLNIKPFVVLRERKMQFKFSLRAAKGQFS
jgi:hypothetical protein